MRFYLWGPAATGKTWLFNAFIRKINIIDAVLAKQRPQPVFRLWFEDKLGGQQHRYTINQVDVPSTTDIDYQEYTLHREYLLSGKQHDVIKRACTHDHQFMMLDGPGDETTGQIAIEFNSEENRAKVLAAREALKDSDYLIMCVEKGAKKLDEGEVGKHYAERLRELLKLTRNPDQRLIICFTKSDLYGGKVAGFDAALRRLFGTYGNEIGNLLQELSGSRQEPPHFFVSAVGYYHTRQGRVAPNFDPGVNQLAQPEDWNPEGVEEPFFDVLTEAELLTLKNMSDDRPGIWGRMTGKFMNDSLRKDVTAAYISYAKMLQAIRVRPS